jgi:hypothetical protein
MWKAFSSLFTDFDAELYERQRSAVRVFRENFYEEGSSLEKVKNKEELGVVQDKMQFIVLCVQFMTNALQQSIPGTGYINSLSSAWKDRIDTLAYGAIPSGR